MPTGVIHPVQSSTDGSRLTVSTMVGMPSFIPERVLRNIQDEFIVDSVFRRGPSARAGAVVFEESSPQYADGEPEVVAEGGEFPIIGASRGLARTMRTTKRGFGLEVTRELRDRNDVGEVQRRMRLARNTLVRAWDRLFQNVILNHPGVHSIAAVEPWYGTTWQAPGSQTVGRSIWHDVTQADQIIRDSTPDEVTRPEDFFGFNPDTIIIPDVAAGAWTNNDTLNSIYRGNIADESMRYTGRMPGEWFGKTVLRSRNMPNDVAILLERGTAGFISDERPMESTPMEYTTRTETYNCYFSRVSVAGLDQPKAVAIITGIRAA